MELKNKRTLTNGVEMPHLGLGVWKVAEGKEAVAAVKYALETGYRLIDTAAVYKNEEGVGEGIRQSGVPRSELFVTTKLWNADQGYESTLQAFDTSLQKLGLDYVDLYLIHWPVAGQYKQSWKALEKIYQSGQAKAIGVSNFQKHHLEDLRTEAQIAPMVNQIELHPMFTQEPLRKYLQEQGIAVEAWSPLGQGTTLSNPTLNKIAAKYNKTAAQIILRWHLQHDIIAIPKSVHEERIKENITIFDFELSSEEMKQIDALNENKRLGPDPDNFNF